ncbi:hypothetical protein OEW28_12165 [Defluviimonas sp. WL0002]|uniref:Uncharacterized protein n=1 Tax=Albidovulum marisflavi TaxID=2984159 RepID=A0ABT2ZE62_9RHOB|nr:hypothetical protein [Defluviimonas sp. WL0002]MCV2869380.1 hypothetical protein [Defluviimonas sp. WL0002]
MKLTRFLALATALAISAAPVSSETIKPKGGSALIGWFGPWYMTKTTFADGSRVCFAHNLSANYTLPRLSILSVVGGKDPGPWVQYQGRADFPPNSQADLTIGKAGFKLGTGSEGPDPVLTPRNEKEAIQIVNALLDAEKGGQNRVSVTDGSGKSYKFSTRQTAKVVGYLERNCDFKH